MMMKNSNKTLITYLRNDILANMDGILY